jgi:hypothetical protein
MEIVFAETALEDLNFWNESGMLLSPFVSTTKNKVNAMERFFDTDTAIIVLLLAYIGLAGANIVVALLVGSIALLAGVIDRAAGAVYHAVAANAQQSIRPRN